MLSLIHILLCQIGGDAIKTFELTGMLSSTRDASIIGQAQQAWKLLWSYVVVIALCGAGIFFCVTIAYKMIKILLIFLSLIHIWGSYLAAPCWDMMYGAAQ